jgi:hypothetical protein
VEWNALFSLFALRLNQCFIMRNEVTGSRDKISIKSRKYQQTDQCRQRDASTLTTIRIVSVGSQNALDRDDSYLQTATSGS